MGSSKTAERSKVLGNDWTDLEFCGFVSMDIIMHTSGVELRKLASGFIPEGDTQQGRIHVNWYEALPVCRVQAKGRPREQVNYTYVGP